MQDEFGNVITDGYEAKVNGVFADVSGVAPRKISLDDIGFIIDWIQSYEVDESDVALIERIHVCSEWLNNQYKIKSNKDALVNAKKEYARVNNVPYKSIRVKK